MDEFFTFSPRKSLAICQELCFALFSPELLMTFLSEHPTSWVCFCPWCHHHTERMELCLKFPAVFLTSPSDYLVTSQLQQTTGLVTSSPSGSPAHLTNFFFSHFQKEKFKSPISLIICIQLVTQSCSFFWNIVSSSFFCFPTALLSALSSPPRPPSSSQPSHLSSISLDSTLSVYCQKIDFPK